MDGLRVGLAPSGLMGDKGFVAEARITIPRDDGTRGGPGLSSVEQS